MKNIPKKVILRNRCGNCWPVEVVETEDGLFFQEGWSMLVSDYPLQGGELMVFKYDGQFIFDIIILNSSQSKKQQVGSFASQEEKKLPTEEENEEEEDVVMDQAENSAKRVKLGRGRNLSFTGYHFKNLEKGIADFFPSDNPFFVTTRRNNDGRNYLIVPYDIRRDNGLKFNNKIMIQDPKGLLFEGKIVVQKDRRLMITNFWKQLPMLNKITKDDIIICELMPTTSKTCQLIKVQIIHPNTIEGQSTTG